jgi:prepilin-type N-terminal cleavage/methylation domain-containing protein
MVLRTCVNRGRDERGATLLELLIALVLLGVVTVGIYAMVITSANAARSTNALLLTQAQVRAALDNIVDEVRWARAVNAAHATCVTVSIPQATPFSPQSPYSVTFALIQNTVRRQGNTNPGAVGCPPVGPADVLAYDVVRPDGSAGLRFEYFDAAGTSLGATPALDRVARIRVVVTTTRDGASRTFAGDVALRAR